MPETATDLKALTRRWFEEVWNKGNTALIDQMLAPDALAHGLGQPSADLRGAAVFRPFYDQFRRAFPDLKIEVQDVLADGDQTATRFTFTATHNGDFQGLEHTQSIRSARSALVRIARSFLRRYAAQRLTIELQGGTWARPIHRICGIESSLHAMRE